MSGCHTERGVETVTALKQRAINMIEKMPEDQVVFVISFIENVQRMPRRKIEDESSKSVQAFQKLQRLARRGTVTDDKKELEEALWEKYESID